MNRKAFLSTIAALFAAPFLSKKEEYIIRPDDANPPKWVKANPCLIGSIDPATNERSFTAIVVKYDVPDEYGNVYKRGCFGNIEEQQIKFQHEVINPFLKS